MASPNAALLLQTEKCEQREGTFKSLTEEVTESGVYDTAEMQKALAEVEKLRHALEEEARGLRVSLEDVTAERAARKAERACVVCLDKDAIHAAMPCGHLVLCEACVVGLKGHKCPMCRAKVKSYLRIFNL